MLKLLPFYVLLVMLTHCWLSGSTKRASMYALGLVAYVPVLLAILILYYE